MKPIDKRLVELNAFINFINDKVFFYMESEQFDKLPETWVKHFTAVYEEIRVREQEARVIKNLTDHWKTAKK